KVYVLALSLNRPSAMLYRELLLWRQDERPTAISREIKDSKRIPNRDPDHTRPIKRIGELEADRHQGDDHGERGPQHPERTAIWPLDTGEAAAKLNEGEALQEIREHRSKHRHVEEHAADEGAGRLSAHGEPHDQHHGKSKQSSGDQGDVRCLVRAVGDRQKMREIACP